MRLPHTITIKRAPLVSDGKGNMIRDWPNAASTTARAWVQPVSSDEQNLNQDRVVSRWKVFLEPSADMVATDRFVHAGTTFQVDGEVQLWDTGTAHHYEAFAKKVSGA